MDWYFKWRLFNEYQDNWKFDEILFHKIAISKINLKSESRQFSKFGKNVIKGMDGHIDDTEIKMLHSLFW